MTAVVQRTLPGRAREELRRYDLTFRVALAILAGLVVVTLFALITGVMGDPEMTVGPRLAAPSWSWPLGTDGLGRSMLPRLFQGIGTTLLLSSLAVIVTAVLGTALGILAGYFGGFGSEAIMRLADVLFAFPALILAILLAALFGPGQIAALASIVLVTVPLMTRMVRVATAAIASKDFVVLAKVSGVPEPKILVRHILSNISGTLVVQGSYALSVGILVEGSLSFLGYGVQLPGASLGLLVQEAMLYMTKAPWLLLSPGIALVLSIVCINLVGDGMRDRFEPRESRSLT